MNNSTFTLFEKSENCAYVINAVGGCQGFAKQLLRYSDLTFICGFLDIPCDS